MEKYFKSVALIRDIDQGRTTWLTCWNADDEFWQFVVADRLEKESFRKSIEREIAWRLDLNRQRDFSVAQMALLNMEYVGFLPNECGEKHVAVAFYPVILKRQKIQESFSDPERFNWLRSNEVTRGMTDHGHTVDPLISQWVNQWRIIQPWTP